MICLAAFLPLCAPSGTRVLQDATGNLRLRLTFSKGVAVDQLLLHGREVLDPSYPVTSGIQVGGIWESSADAIQPSVTSSSAGRITVSGIEYGHALPVRETWTFTAKALTVEWRIDRTYLASGQVERTAMPGFHFPSMNTFTGAVLGTGGVAWFKLFDQPNSTYGVHTSTATFWNATQPGCLRLTMGAGGAANHALTFTRQPDGECTVLAQSTQEPLKPALNLANYRKDNQTIWAGFPVKATERVSSTLTLASPGFQESFHRGDFKGLNTPAITELVNTIGRIGVIDVNHIGTNGWYSGYVCLHEPWLALLGSMIDDPNYTANYASALDFERQHALQPDGMMLSRWCYDSGDATAGTYNAYGYYEAQWGRLMDTQSSYVCDVADEFDENGSLAWVRGQKAACEAVLGYLLKRDSNGNHLVEMENSSLTQRRSSDWMDIVWASYENGFVNAQLYGALRRWAHVERVLGDQARSHYYEDYANQLKRNFNKTIDQGGFWNPAKGWYVYWREPDGSTHGDNLAIHVNLTALAEGLCDDPARRKQLMDVLEAEMVRQNLLAWPSCMTSYAPGEYSTTHWPEYENGDIFLSWVESGIKAYVTYKPGIALKYVKQITKQYEKDGLAFQRYLRSNGQGAGDDILAGNASAILGLYRDIYGIQPKYNRLLLDPHLLPELNGTEVDYRLRGQPLRVTLSQKRYRVASGKLAATSGAAFGVDFKPHVLTLFTGRQEVAASVIKCRGSLEATVPGPGAGNVWSFRTRDRSVRVTQSYLALGPGTYEVMSGGRRVGSVSRNQPSITFVVRAGATTRLRLTGPLPRLR